MLRFIRHHLLWQPRKGLQLVAQAVAYCVRATTIEKRLEKRKLKRNLRAAKLFADSAAQARESMTQMLEWYDEEIAFKLMGTSDISALRKVRDMFPHKVLVFSVGASVSAPTLEEMGTAAESLGLEGLCTSALFELRDGGFRMLEEAEARAKGYVYRGIYGHV